MKKGYYHSVSAINQDRIEFENRISGYRALERLLEIPTKSIQNEYHKYLVLGGVHYSQASKIYDELLEISVQTIFVFQTVWWLWVALKDIAKVKSICEYCSDKDLDPIEIAGIILKE